MLRKAARHSGMIPPGNARYQFIGCSSISLIPSTAVLLMQYGLLEKFTERLIYCLFQSMKVGFLIGAVMVVQLAACFDFYLIRHGARSPVRCSLPNVFGVQMGHLTMAGRSQVYFLGKELKLRHGGIPINELAMASTTSPRTRETAEYLLKGWYGLDREETHLLRTNSKIVKFHADPKFVPPVQLSFEPLEEVALVNSFAYRSLVDTVINTPHREELSAQLKRFHESRLCEKAERIAPGICNHTDSFFAVSDLITCLEFQGLELPGITEDEKELAAYGFDLTQAEKMDPHYEPNIQVQDILHRLRASYLLEQTSLAVEVNHDGNLLGVLRFLIGHEEFLQLGTPNLTMQFLSVVRFRVRDGEIKLYYNTEQLPLTICYEQGERVCRTSVFMSKLFD